MRVRGRCGRFGLCCLAAACAVLGGLLSVLILSPASGAATSVSRPAAGDTWPTFGHGPLHGGVSSDAAIGTSTASGLSQRWSVSLGSSGYDQASPAVAYNTKLRETVVYAVSYRGVVSALNAATGTLVWQRSLGSMVESSTPVYQSSPAVYGGTVYVGDHNGTLHALNAATGAVAAPSPCRP